MSKLSRWNSLTSAQKNRVVHTRVMDLPASDAEVPAYTESIDAAWQVLQRMEESCIIVHEARGSGLAREIFLSELTRSKECYSGLALFTLQDLASLTPLKICETALKVLCNDIDFGESEE